VSIVVVRIETNLESMYTAHLSSVGFDKKSVRVYELYADGQTDMAQIIGAFLQCVIGGAKKRQHVEESRPS
jgi:hypothetical protein